VLFESTEDGPIRIGLMNADGTNALVMTDETSASGGADWSPDGSQIVFQRSPWTTAGSGAGEIWVMNADGTGQHAITHAPEAAQENGWPVDDEPRWSPDGSLIAFVRGTDVYTVSPDGSNLTDLTPGGGTEASDRGIAWSPDGSRILFASGRGSEYRLYTMNRDGSEARPFLDRSVATCCPEADWSGAATFAETVGPEPTISPTPQDTPDSIGQDIGLGFRVCDVTSVTGRFVPGIEGTAFVATRMGDTGECPPLDGATQVLAVDVDGDGLSDTSYDPLECDQWCNAFAAPDVDRDGDDELLVQNVQFSIKGLKLFEVQLWDGGAGLGPVVVAPPGSGVFEGGTEPQLWLGGDEGNWDAIRCEPFGNGRALVSTTSSHPVDAPGDRIVTETWFVLEGIELRVVDVREYSAPVDDDTQPYLQMDGCGASFPYP
jgi:TolB protein